MSDIEREKFEQASRQEVEGDVITDLKAEILTERDPSDEYDSFLVFVSRGKSEPYLFIPETLDDAILDEVVKRINTHPASRQAVSVPEWIKCSDRLPTDADGDCEGMVWVYATKRGEATTLRPSVVRDFYYSDRIKHWMPTGLKSPQPPRQEQGK
jgi:hypothetical protein